MRAKCKLDKPSTLKHKRPEDPTRFIKDYPVTEDGELASHTLYELDEKAIAQEERFDGFYVVCTNLEGGPETILEINKQRWQIEDAFRTLKTEFKARPVYLQRDDRILAHFMTCFLALLLLKILKTRVEKYLPGRHLTNQDVLETLQNMNFHALEDAYYVPNYTRTDLTDALHEAMGFRTDFEVISAQQMKKILKETHK